MTINNSVWWKDATIYQIWPASYKDSNGDGVGDIGGIISTLDYIKSLGTDVIWLSPHYDSPQDDMGYDISDYNKIYSKYGDMHLMDQLIEQVHAKGMKLILDLVINHTSSQHAWFQESKSSLDNPKRDWYIWKSPKFDPQGNRLPPNNWESYFSGSAWEWDDNTSQYYLRLFAKSQPDLNWDNEHVRNEIYNVALKFWFDKGVDGFRIDTAGMYSKHPDFPDAPIVFPDQTYQPSGLYTNNGPRIHEFYKEMYDKVTKHYDAMTVGEVGHSTREEALKYVSAKEKEMNMIFLFNVVDCGATHGDRFRYQGFNLLDFKKAVEDQCEFTQGTDAWSTVFIENHDQPRSVTRFANASPKHWSKSAKLLTLLQTSLTGTLFIYQGQEIGMTNFPRSWSIEEYLDINTINYWQKFLSGNPTEQQKQQLMDAINLTARDHARSPVQWDSSDNAGFTSGTPWMRVNDNYKEINVASQVDDPNSVFSFWQKSLKVRKENKDLLIHGSFKILDFEDDKLFTYIKASDASAKKAYVVLNFSPDSVPFAKKVSGDFTLINSNVDKVEEDTLSPYEGRIYLVD